ncbi:MAG: glycosyltransferase family 2 protein [Candidatus Sulfotelmatobacter sp.]
MNPKPLPRVSVVTPVYNGVAYLAECIESVLAQSYENWDYTIVDNCSSDGSLEIARRYAALDARIRVKENTQTLRAVSNHNVALRQISAVSKYCKIVFADDWIFPECLEQMVSLAEEYPSVGIVGAYGIQDHEVMWTGLPYYTRRIPGRWVCRQLFLTGLYVFGTSTSVLYRSDLVREQDSFYNEANFHADMEACIELLKACDFGFVHQVLTFKRVEQGSLGAISEDFGTLRTGYLHSLVTHGRDFLTDEEFEVCLRRCIREYYSFLAASLLRGRRDREFWRYHNRKLTEAGVGLSWGHLAAAILARIVRAGLNPYETVQRLRRSEDPKAELLGEETADGIQPHPHPNRARLG